jgi:CheY-like chemotaxis protein
VADPRENNKVDLLLSDVMMPNMNGLKLAEAMVADSPDIKVVFMSGCLHCRNTPRFKNGFIQKPFSSKP